MGAMAGTVVGVRAVVGVGAEEDAVAGVGAVWAVVGVAAVVVGAVAGRRAVLISR